MGFFNFFSSQKETPKQPQSSEAQLHQICLQISVKHRSLQLLLCSRHWQLHQLMQKGQRWLKR